MDLPNTTPLIQFVILFTAAMCQINDNDSGGLIVITPNSSETWSASQPDTDQNLPSDGGPNCKCVEYYLCSPENTVLQPG
jgi:hypothetical protein